MLINRNVQKVINIIVIVLLLSMVAVGAVLTLPADSPLGPILGKIFNSKDILVNFVDTLDPKEIAQAVNEDPQMLVELLSLLDEDNIALAVNMNEEFLCELIASLDP